jgi:hypothetical protein
MVFPQALKSGLKPSFSLKSKVAVPKLQFWNSLYALVFLPHRINIQERHAPYRQRVSRGQQFQIQNFLTPKMPRIIILVSFCS